MADLLIPQVIDDYRVYLDGEEVQGVTEVELPTPQALVETINGPGILGDVEVPTAHLEPMTLRIKFRGPSTGAFKLAASGPLTLDVRAAALVEDPSDATTRKAPLKVMMVVKRKTGGLGGVLTPSKAMDADMEFAVHRYVASWDGQEQIEIQPLARIFKVQGEDMLAETNQIIS
ncbi:MAG: phage major tail tube protein [Deltaproteobacteria bacterium]|nr:phage major tail tube protein [Deltaproteobacteria bacterium]